MRSTATGFALILALGPGPSQAQTACKWSVDVCPPDPSMVGSVLSEDVDPVSCRALAEQIALVCSLEHPSSQPPPGSGPSRRVRAEALGDRDPLDGVDRDQTLDVFYYPPLESASPRAPLGPSPLVGAIRSGHSSQTVSSSVAPDEPAPRGVAARRLLDAEIERASRGGLDYWVFVRAPDTPPRAHDPLALYLESPLRERLRFALAVPLGFLCGADGGGEKQRWTQHLGTASYLRVLGDRPLVFVLGQSPDPRAGCETRQVPKAVGTFRRRLRRQGHGNPYLVLVDDDPWQHPGSPFYAFDVWGLDAVATPPDPEVLEDGRPILPVLSAREPTLPGRLAVELERVRRGDDATAGAVLIDSWPDLLAFDSQADLRLAGCRAPQVSLPRGGTHRLRGFSSNICVTPIWRSSKPPSQ